MAKKRAKTDPLPEEFPSYEAAADFWDSHDTTDYPAAFRTVPVVGQFRGRRFEIEIEGDVVAALRQRARRRGITPGRLASSLLRRQLVGATTRQ
jgi:hypothetical protein